MLGGGQAPESFATPDARHGESSGSLFFTFVYTAAGPILVATDWVRISIGAGPPERPSSALYQPPGGGDRSGASRHGPAPHAWGRRRLSAHPKKGESW
jgi:hypothetical protein